MSPFALLIGLILGNGVIMVIGDEAYIPYNSTYPNWIVFFEPHYSCPGRGVMDITDITYGSCCRLWCREWYLRETSTIYHNIIYECHEQRSCRYIASRDYNNCGYFERKADELGLDFDYLFVYFTCKLGPVNPTDTAQTLPPSTSSSSNDVTEEWMLETMPGGEELTFPVSMGTRPQETAVSEVPTAAASSVNPTETTQSVPSSSTSRWRETTTGYEVPTAAASSGSVDVTLVAGVTVGVAVLVVAAAVLAAIFVCRKRGRKEPKPAVRTDNVYSGSPTGGKTETGPSVNLQSQLGQAFYTNHDDELVIHDNANYATHGNVMTLADNGGDDLVIQDNMNYAAHGDVMTPDDNSKDDLVIQDNMNYAAHGDVRTPDDNSKDDLVIQDNINYAAHGDVMNDDLVVEDNMNYAAY